jgi:hypothetical protein
VVTKNIPFNIGIHRANALFLALWTRRMRMAPAVSEDDAHFHALSRIEAGIPITCKVDIPFRGRVLDDEPPSFDFSNCLSPKLPEVDRNHCGESLYPSLN